MAKKILLADDSVTIQKVVSITLAHEDFDLTIVDNGSKALAKAKEIKPDVILLDVVMPDKDGYQVCQEIKGNAELRNTPVILLTGTFEPFDADRAAEVGADDFIKKPFESHTLINKVKEMAAKSGVPRERPVDISEVDIGFETPVEGEYATKEAPREAAGVEEPVEAELETPWEDEGEAARPTMKEQESEDIWSVEELEDITGSKGGTKAPAEAAPPREEVPKEAPAPKRAAAPAVSDDFFVRDEKAPDLGSDDFELGEEISEDELEKFLEEEDTEADIGVEEATVADDLEDSDADGGILLGEEEGPSPRAEARGSGGFEEDLLVEDFEEFPAEAPKGGRRQSEDVFAEESDDEQPVELEWEDEPVPDRAAGADAGAEAGEFETLIRRTTEDELREFSRESDRISDSGRSTGKREFEVDLGAFEEEPDEEIGGRERPEPSTFDFEDLSEETPPAKKPAGPMGAPDESSASLTQKDVSKAVDKIAREVIEKVVWEVVPELAEELIKQEIKRLKGDKA
jgi:CheY-like chemotaxis protein